MQQRSLRALYDDKVKPVAESFLSAVEADRRYIHETLSLLLHFCTIWPVGSFCCYLEHFSFFTKRWPVILSMFLFSGCDHTLVEFWKK